MTTVVFIEGVIQLIALGVGLLVMQLIGRAAEIHAVPMHDEGHVRRLGGEGGDPGIGPLAGYVEGLGRDDRAVLARAVALINFMLDQQNSAKKGPSD